MSDSTKKQQAKEKRIALAKNKTPKQEFNNSKQDFKKYFVQLQSEMNLKDFMEEVLWVHLKSIKHDKKEMFDEGIKNFGYKI